MDILSNPLVVALLALIAIPAVTSGLTGLIRKFSDATDVPPQAVVYVASMIVVGVAVWIGGLNLPVWSGDPAGFVSAWLVWATANAGLTRTLYDVIWGRLFSGDG